LKQESNDKRWSIRRILKEANVIDKTFNIDEPLSHSADILLTESAAEMRLLFNLQVPYGGSFHVELYWTATRVEQSQTRLQVLGRFVPEKRMIGVAGMIKKATNEVLPLWNPLCLNVFGTQTNGEANV